MLEYVNFETLGPAMQADREESELMSTRTEHLTISISQHRKLSEK